MDASELSGLANVPDLYDYESLQAYHIRLVSILPGEWDETLCCSIHSVKLPRQWERRSSQFLSYEALSYAWGSTSEKVPVFCSPSGKAVFVTPNCLFAMRRLRLSTETRVVWIDAVCINQSNIPERNAQVRMMPTIYEGATRVIVYLGEDDGDSIEAMDYINEMSAPPKHPDDDDLGRIIDHWKRPMPDQERQNRRNEAVQTLLKRPWFNRVWVLQEVAKGRKVLVICGTRTLAWEKISGFYSASAFKGSPLDTKGLFPAVFTLTSSTDLDTRALPGLLQLTRSYKATDPRDKVFALFGMLHEPEKHGLVADYNQPDIEVFTKVAVWAIRASRNLEILSEVQGPTTLHSAGMPSWVPDWSVPVERSKLVDLFEDSVFVAGGKHLSARVIWKKGRRRQQALKARGIIIGKIARLGGTFHRQQVEPNALHQFFGSWTTIAIKDGKYGNPELNELALCLSMCVGSGLVRRIQEQGMLNLFIDYFLWRAIHLGEDVSAYGEVDDLIQRYYTNDGPSTSIPPEEEVRKQHIARANSFHAEVQKHCHLRRLLVTENGYIGLAPKEASVGDTICVLYGANTPQVLSIHKGHFTMVGECYIQGAMFGEALPVGHPDKYPGEGSAWGPAGPSLEDSEQDFNIS